MSNEKMYTIKEVAKILNYATRTIYEWIRTNKIEAIKVGSEWRIEKKEVMKKLKGEKV